MVNFILHLSSSECPDAHLEYFWFQNFVFSLDSSGRYVCRSLNLIRQWLGLFLQIVALLILGKISYMYIYFDQLCLWLLKTFSPYKQLFHSRRTTLIFIWHQLQYIYMYWSTCWVVRCMHVHCRLLSLVSYRLKLFFLFRDSDQAKCCTDGF